LRELLGRERFGRAEGHMASVVHDDIDATGIGHDLCDRRIY
jgi:hypothetical protein